MKMQAYSFYVCFNVCFKSESRIRLRPIPVLGKDICLPTQPRCQQSFILVYSFILSARPNGHSGMNPTEAKFTFMTRNTSRLTFF